MNTRNVGREVLGEGMNLSSSLLLRLSWCRVHFSLVVAGGTALSRVAAAQQDEAYDHENEDGTTDDSGNDHGLRFALISEVLVLV